MENKCNCLACKSHDYYQQIVRNSINNLPVKQNWLFSKKNSLNNTYQCEKTALVDEKML